MKTACLDKRWLLTGLAIALIGCAETAQKAAPPRPVQYASAGRASGSACGLELLDLIPIAATDRAQRAYNEALAQAGAKALVGTQFSDSRIDLMVGTMRCTRVEGTAVY